MAKFVDLIGNRFTVDRGNNEFKNGKCVNPLKDSFDEIGSQLEDVDLIPVMDKVEATGHVPNFTYGLDENGKPFTVNTGHKAW